MGAGDLGEPASYATAGVDLDAADLVVDRIKGIVASTARREVIGGAGGFAGLFSLDTERYPHPVLVASTDGVGTKLLVAQAADRYDTVGIDLVAMCVDDLVCVGAEPLFLLDYLAVGRLDPDRVAALVGGVAEGCRRAGCALLGGETAEHPGAMGKEDFDLAGCAVGVLERGTEIGAHRVGEGDVLIGLLSPGLRSNGYSLARHALLERAGRSLEAPAWPGAPRSLADELLVPSVIYAPAVRAALAVGGVHAAAHITGGGIPGNLARILPEGRGAVVERDRWDVPRIFSEVARAGEIAEAEMARVFNLGIGLILAVERREADGVAAALAAAGAPGAVIGEVVAGAGVRLA
ncbi:MAG TPA: phosphoribosylformylglycinamidine cyclo-ligase [Acidimicrobiales bacterium]|nr:phosphoribosylformylglycinamidine cyclo-ligase [Acidimicrobiales bacterium]